MKRKILFFACTMAGISILVTAALIHFAVYRDFALSMERNTVSAAGYIRTALELPAGDFPEPWRYGDASGIRYLEALPPDRYGLRITLIAADGRVLYDTAANAESLENHLDRPEVRAALAAGAGGNTRFSDTMRKQHYYYALRLRNGNVLRVANTMDSIFVMMFNLGLITLGIAAAVFFAAVLAGSRVTGKLVNPINSLDLDNPENNVVYDELAPLLFRIKRQNEAISAQLTEMRKWEIEFTAIADNMREGLLVLDQDARILSCNKSARDLLGVQPEHIEKQNVLAVRRDEPFRDAVKKALGGTAAEAAFSSGKRYLQMFANPMTDNGAVQGLVLVILDVTEREDRDKLRRGFTANVSHELKTPLMAISGYAEIMAGGVAKPEDMPRFARSIYQEAQRLITLVGDIMTLSRLDEKNESPAVERVDIFSLARDVLERIGGAAAARNIPVLLNGAEAEITGIRQVLDEMIFNLLDNAVKYNIDGGKIHVSVEKLERECVFSVSDTGIGIPVDEQDRIFERFYRVDKSRSRTVEGTGLGLSIVKHGAALHNAKIEVQSDGKTGTCFTLRFPASWGGI